MDQDNDKIRLKIPAEVARIMSKWGGHQMRLAAARGAVPMSGPNLVMVLFVFYHGENQELKDEALNTLRTLPANILLAALAQPGLHPAIIDLIVKLRYRDPIIMQDAITHPMIGLKTLLFLAKQSRGDVLDMLSHHDEILRKADVIRIAIINNPHTEKTTKIRLGWSEPEADKEPETTESDRQATAEDTGDEPEEEDPERTDEELEDESLSKYQMLQEMGVSEKSRWL